MRVTIKDLPKAEAYFRSLVLKMKDFRPAWRQINHSLTEFFRQQFETEGQAGGQPWQSRTIATLMLLAKKGRLETKILHDSGALERSLTQPTPSKLGLRIINRKSLTWGSLVQGHDGFPYAVAAQEGFTSTYRPVFSQKGEVRFVPREVPLKIKPRVLLPEPLPGFLVADWEQILINYVQQKQQRSGAQ